MSSLWRTLLRGSPRERLERYGCLCIRRWPPAVVAVRPGRAYARTCAPPLKVQTEHSPLSEESISFGPISKVHSFQDLFLFKIRHPLKIIVSFWFRKRAAVVTFKKEKGEEQAAGRAQAVSETENSNLNGAQKNKHVKKKLSARRQTQSPNTNKSARRRASRRTCVDRASRCKGLATRQTALMRLVLRLLTWPPFKTIARLCM